MARSARKTAGINAAAWFARQSFHTLITAPTTGARLDAMLEDNRATDARILAERDEEREADWRADREGDACGRACGYCGRCS